LPDLNIAAKGPASWLKAVEKVVENMCRAAKGAAGRERTVQGGWTTRRHGRPEAGFHGIQMVPAQAIYLNKARSWAWSAAKAARLRPQLSRIIMALHDLVETGDLTWCRSKASAFWI